MWCAEENKQLPASLSICLHIVPARHERCNKTPLKSLTYLELHILPGNDPIALLEYTTKTETSMNSIRRCAPFLAMIVIVGGCAANGSSYWTSNDEPLTALEDQTTIQVENNNWSDMVVYVLLHQTRMRLGMVNSMTTTNFRLPRGIAASSGSFRIIAEPIGSRSRYVSEPISLFPGQRLELRLQNALPISSWSIW